MMAKGRWMKRLAASVWVPGVLLACSSTADPAKASVNLAFPSTAAAVSTDNVTVMVFDLPTDGTANQFCTKLVQQAKSDQQLPPRTVESAPANVCDFQNGIADVTVDFGDKAILAVARRGGKPYLVGCALENIGDGDAPVTISLGLVNTATVVPPTDCQLVSDFCVAKSCKGVLP